MAAGVVTTSSREFRATLEGRSETVQQIALATRERILAHNAHVALAFPLGAELDDPARLLGGTGARVRNVRLDSLDEVRRPELRALIMQAVRHRMPPPPAAVALED